MDLNKNVRDYVFAVAMKYVKDEDAAADITQDALLKIHLHGDSFRGDSRASTWIYRVAATTALMYLRARRRRWREVPVSAAEGGEEGLLNQLPAEAPTPEQQVSEAESVRSITAAIEHLGDKYSGIFWRRYWEGQTETEIARDLQLPTATIKTRAHRARIALRARLQLLAA